MLYIIGTGIYDERDMSLKGVDALRKCRKVYAEFYTCPVNVNMAALEKHAGKKIQILNRQQVEEEDIIPESAGREDTAFLVGGDALSATTHIDLVLRCRKKRVPVSIIHASSIFTAAAECGLQLYKFGRTVSLPYPKENYFPKSPYENILRNLKEGLHTLLLLDIGMTANEGVEVLLALEKKLKKNIIRESTKIVCLAHVGSDSGSKIVYVRIKDVKDMDLGDMPHCIIIPAKLHFTEEEYLKTL